MSRLDDVLAILQTSIQAAIVNSGAPGSTQTWNGTTFTIDVNGQVMKGAPDGPELVKVIANADPITGIPKLGAWQVTLDATLPAQPDVMFRPRNRVRALPVVPMTASVDDFGVITFGGTFTNGLNVHAVINQSDALVASTTAGSISNVATDLAAAINALNLPGVSASASGQTVTTHGAYLVKCNIVGTGTITREVNRFKRIVLATIWASDPVTRSAIQTPIEQNVGNVLTQWNQLPDLTWTDIKCFGECWADGGQQQYGVLKSVLQFQCRYGIMQDLVGYQIGATESVTVVNNNPPVTIFSGGN